MFVLFSFCALTCKKESPVAPKPPPPSGPDTTSHNFTFTQYTFGGLGGSSYFKDVAIVSDTDIWAVGAIYTSPDSTYNAAHWDGKKWLLKQVPFVGSCSAVMYPPLQGIWAFGTNNILFTNGGSIVHFDGTNAEMDCGMNSLLSGAINKIFAINLDNIYIVGNAGTIIHYDGTTWTKQSSGTTIDLYDVWGTADGSVVWACGYSNDNFHSILLKYENNQWLTLWQRDGSTAVAPFGYNVGSIWRASSTYITSTNGVFRLDSDASQTQLSSPFSGFTPSLRGNADNDFVVVGDNATIWHYNGKNGKELFGGIATQPLDACGLRGNILVAVGSDYSTFPNKALIYVGLR